MSDLEERTYGVTELAGELNRLITAAFPSEVWVRGQIRNLSRSAAGHAYFDLVDPAPLGERPAALIPITLFNTERQQVNQALTASGGGVRMVDGVEIRLRGRLGWYAQGGRLQVRMTAIDPEYTLGRLTQDRDRLIAALTAEGLLARNGLLPVPVVPLRVGLITSAGSAAAADFLQELQASGFGWQVTLADVLIQGTSSERLVVAALEQLASRRVDIIALVRGGGARTELATFDREGIARAIAACPVPVFTGIGHETDTAVADLVAAYAAKTPTACAAELVNRVQRFVIDTDGCWAAIAARAERRLLETDQVLIGTAHHVAQATRVGLAVEQAGNTEAARRLARNAPALLARADQALDATAGRLSLASRRPLQYASRAVDAFEAQVHAWDPARTLARGWSISRHPDGRVIRRAADLIPGDRVITTVADGTFSSEVLTSHPDTPDLPAPSAPSADPPPPGATPP